MSLLPNIDGGATDGVDIKAERFCREKRGEGRKGKPSAGKATTTPTTAGTGKNR